MVFTSPSWTPSLPFDPPNSIPIHEFQFQEKYGRCQFQYAQDPFTCGLSGKTRSVQDTKARIEHLAQGLAKATGWKPNTGSEWDKVVNIFSVNDVDYMVLTWAVHRLNGICAPISAGASPADVEKQLTASHGKVLFTHSALLPKAMQAAKAAGIPDNHIYLLDSPSSNGVTNGATHSPKSVNDLVSDGLNEPSLEALTWQPGQGAKQVAFLCFSSGTSGPPKGVMITHHNMIANVMQACVFESVERHLHAKGDPRPVTTGHCLGVLPLSHAHALCVAQISVYRGEGMIVLPSFDFKACFSAIGRYKIANLWLVPSILELMVRSKDVLKHFDLSAVEAVVSGSAPLKKKTAEALQAQYPTWKIRQGYGLTEASTTICFTPGHDIVLGSVGSLLPGFEAKLISPDGTEITENDVPGELVVRSPSISPGYYNDDESTAQTFVDGWLRTGDEAMFCKSPNGHEHVFITDRIKELIKVRGHQVSPTELEAFIITHPDVADCCVVPVPDALSGEAPKAFVVRAQGPETESVTDDDLKQKIQKYVADNQTDYKRLKGGVEFIDIIPRDAGGKLLRRILKQRG